MIRPLLSSSFSSAAVLGLCAMLTAPLPAAAQPGQARYAQDRRFDGFCYVHQDSVQAQSETDYWGTRRGYGRCYRGEYYVYTGRYVAAPQAPEGYVARYFTRRPDKAFYDRVYNASTLTENFDPNGDDRARNDYYNDSYNNDSNRNYNRDDRRDDGRAYDRDSRVEEYPADPYSRTDDRRPTSDNNTDQVGRYEQSAPSDDYARDSRGPDADGYVAPYDARQSYPETEGWQDDQGAWHIGRPRAVGWQDDNGQWHEGQVQTYGRRDRNGEWHETQGDAGGQ